MKFVPKRVSISVARAILQTQKHSPTILFASGVVGIVVAGVLACRATLELDDVLTQSEKDLLSCDTDRARTVTKLQTSLDIVTLYTPAVIVGTLAVGSLAGSHHLLSRRNAALTAAYAGLERTFGEYRKRVVDEIGTDKERELHYQSVTNAATQLETGTRTQLLPNDRSQYARFFDESSRNWVKTPEYNLLFIRCQQNYANDLLQSRGHVFLNEIYDMLDIPRSKAGSVVGWVISKAGDNFVDFGIFTGDTTKSREFVNGQERSILLDFNVDGVIWDKI